MIDWKQEGEQKTEKERCYVIYKQHYGDYHNDKDRSIFKTHTDDELTDLADKLVDNLELLQRQVRLLELDIKACDTEVAYRDNIIMKIDNKWEDADVQEAVYLSNRIGNELNGFRSLEGTKVEPSDNCTHVTLIRENIETKHIYKDSWYTDKHGYHFGNSYEVELVDGEYRRKY